MRAPPAGRRDARYVDDRAVFADSGSDVVDVNSRLEIDLAAIEHNVATVRRACSASLGRDIGVCSVLKADAYGLGAARIAKRLEIAAVEMIAVFTPDQARALVEAAIRTPLLVLMPVRSFLRTDPLYRAVVEGRLHFSVHDDEQVSSLIKHADRFGVVLPMHIEVNTGMNRGGAKPDEAARLAARIAAHPRLVLAGAYTHFSSAESDDELTREQAAMFAAWLEKTAALRKGVCPSHQAATFATFRSADLHGDMVRVGAALLGYCAEEIADPENCELMEHARALKPAVRWVSRVAHITQRIEEGEAVGYGATWRAKRPTRLALAPVGYADGYPLALSNKGMVRVEAPGGVMMNAPVVGRVSMDQITIDVTDLPEGAVKIDTPVELIGAERGAANHLPTLAHAAGTVFHELLCRLSPRIPRVYRAVESQTFAALGAAGG